MRVSIFLLLSLLLCGATASPATARGRADEGRICVGGPQWRPTLEESLKVRDAPVPQSYRKLSDSPDVCTQWALNRHALVDWHIQFGDEESARTALAYIEQSYLGTIPAPND